MRYVCPGDLSSPRWRLAALPAVALYPASRARMLRTRALTFMLAALATALLVLSPSRRAACTRAPCGSSCVLELFARALSMLAAPPAVVYERASQARMLRTLSSSSCRHPSPTNQGSPSSVSSANRDMQCARGPCAARGSTLDSDLELSGPCWRSPGWRRSQLGAGIPGLDAHDPTPLSVSAARSDWSRLTKLCLLRAVPCV